MELPDYDSKELLKAKLDFAIDYGMGVWGMS
jgi:hypothetical protein